MFLHQSCDKFAANSLNSFYCFYSQTCWIFKATIKVTISIIRKYFSIFVFYFCSTRLLFSAAFLTIYNYCWYWRLSFPPTRNFHYLTKIISITKLENQKNILPQKLWQFIKCRLLSLLKKWFGSSDFCILFLQREPKTKSKGALTNVHFQLNVGWKCNKQKTYLLVCDYYACVDFLVLPDELFRLLD